MSDVIDLKDFLERVQDDKELLVELLDIYEQDFVVKKQALDQAVAQKNTVRIKEIAHSLKGASGNISAKSIYSQCVQIEQLAAANQIDNIVPLLRELDEKFKAVQQYTQKVKKEFAA